MNNTSKSNSKAKLICIIAGLLVVILAIALAFTFISKPQQTKDTEDTEIYTKQNESYEQQTVTKDIKTNVKDSTYGEAIPEEADQSSKNIEQAGDMNGDTSEGVEISEELREYNESQVTEEDNTAEWTEEPKQEDVYVPATEPQVDNTPSTPEAAPTPEPAPADNSDLDWGDSSDGSNVDWESPSSGWLPPGAKHYEWH